MSKQYFGFEQVASAAEGSFFGKKTGGFQASRTVCKLENPQNRRLIWWMSTPGVKCWETRRIASVFGLAGRSCCPSKLSKIIEAWIEMGD